MSERERAGTRLWLREWEGKGERSERGQTTRCHTHTRLFGSGIECMVCVCACCLVNHFIIVAVRCCCRNSVCMCLWVSVSVYNTPVHVCCVCVFSLNFNSFWPFDAVVAATAVFVIHFIQWFRFLTNTNKITITCTSFDSAVCVLSILIYTKICCFSFVGFRFRSRCLHFPKTIYAYVFKCFVNRERAEANKTQNGLQSNHLQIVLWIFRISRLFRSRYTVWNNLEKSEVCTHTHTLTKIGYLFGFFECRS